MRPSSQHLRTWDLLIVLGCVLWCSVTGAQDLAPRIAPASGTTLTNLAQIGDLSDGAIRTNHYRAKVRGVVTYVNPQGARFYLQQGDEVAYVDTTIEIPRTHASQEVEVTGPIRPGWLVPAIAAESVELIGRSVFPSPQTNDVTLLNSGVDAMHFVSVEGVVRDMMLEGTNLNLLLLVMEKGIAFRVHAPLGVAGGFPRDWLDAKIEARGLCRPMSDNFGNAFGFLIYQNNTNLTRVVEGGNPSLFQQPTLTIAQARLARPANQHRIKISGTVTAHIPGQLLYLQDSTGVMRVELLSLLPHIVGDGEYLEHEPQTLLTPGEVVEVIGARHDGLAASPTLVHGEFRRVTKSPPISPVAVNGAALASGRFAGRLVNLRARLLDRRSWTEGKNNHEMLVLESGGRVFQALWQGEMPVRWQPYANTYFRVTGINEIELGQLRKLRSINLLLRGPSDVVGVTPPVFWQREEFRKPLIWVGWVAFGFTILLLLQLRQMQRLRASEERFRALIEHSFDVTVVLDAAGAIKYMSPSGVKLLGRPEGRQESAMVWDIIHPEDLAAIRKTHDEVLQHPGATKSLSGYRLVTRTGEIRYAEAVGTNCLDVPGVRGVVVNVRDITERKLALDQIQRTVMLQSCLNEFATSLSPLHSEEDIVWEITRKCISVLGFMDCVVYLPDEESGTLRQRAAYGPKNPMDREILEPIAVPLGQGIVGSVAASCRAEIVPDTRKDPRYIIDDCARLSEITVPILAEGKLLGVIDSEHPDANFFTQEHLAILTGIASLCANKLVRARAEQQLLALNADLERRIEARTAELRAINAQLRQSEEKFSKAFQASPIILGIARLSDGCFIDVNEACLEALGLSRQEVIGHTAVEVGVWRNDGERHAFVQEVRARGHIRNREFNISIQGKPRMLSLSAELIVIGNEPCIVSVSADITERHQAQAELLRALARERELSELKSRFVATISHEFRTPLGVVLSSADILARYSERLPVEQRREHLRDIQQSAMEMARQMENVLVFGRSEASRLEYSPSPLDLVALCRKLVGQISTATEDRCPIEVRFADAFPQIMADEALLTHVITNLLSNAVKYSPPKSKVELQCGMENGSIALMVRDCGMGIPMRDLSSIFMPFQRGSNVGRVRGTGMGLTIVKRCAELHQGEIEIRSEEGAGTVVSVRWPRMIVPAEAAVSPG